MASNDQRPVVAPLDFNTIKADMVAYFQSRPEFKDYNFTGSSLNLLMDILAYNTHYNSLAANFLTNEMFLDTAVLRDSVVSIAKMLNYQPKSARAASMQLTLAFRQPDPSVPLTLLPAGSQFTARGTNKSYYFYTIKDNVVQYRTDSENLVVTVYQGSPVTQRFIATSLDEQTTFPAYQLLSNNIDTSTIAVTVNGQRYSQVTPENEGILGVTADSRIFFVEETTGSQYRIVLGNGVIGQKPNPGDEILVTYLVTDGPAANGISLLAPNISTLGFRKIVGYLGKAQGGENIETIREIKQNAPHWFQAQYRAVTAEDYKVVLRQTYPDLRAINVYGGETVGNPGKVYISIKPKNADVLSDVAKQTITRDILAKYNLVTVTPVLVDPEIVKLVFKSVVQYDPALSLTDPTVIRAKVYNLFNTLNDTYIGDFLQTFYISRLSQAISELDPSIVASNTRVSLRYDNSVTGGVIDRPTFSFNNRIYHPLNGYVGADGGGVLSSSLFYRKERPFQSGYDDDGMGNIRLYDFVDNVKSYVSYKAGTVNYDTGSITLSQEFDLEDGPISFDVLPDSFDVLAEQNTLLFIAPEDSVVYVIDKNDTASLRAFDTTRSA